MWFGERQEDKIFSHDLIKLIILLRVLYFHLVLLSHSFTLGPAIW